MRIATRAVAGALLAGAFAAAPASAQINFFTTGTFASGAATCNGTNVCAQPGGGFTLTYLEKSVDPIGYANGSIVSLGNFQLQGTGEVTAAPGSVLFTLAIHQTNPTTGVGTTVGSVSGTVSTVGGNFSSLIWTPAPQVININGTTYSIIFDHDGYAAGRGINIAINNTGTPTSVNAIVATPEPASMTLLATGLIGIFGAARRSRKNKLNA
jgi:hypothetical protein